MYSKDYFGSLEVHNWAFKRHLDSLESIVSYLRETSTIPVRSIHFTRDPLVPTYEQRKNNVNSTKPLAVTRQVSQLDKTHGETVAYLCATLPDSES